MKRNLRNPCIGELFSYFMFFNCFLKFDVFLNLRYYLTCEARVAYYDQRKEFSKKLKKNSENTIWGATVPGPTWYYISLYRVEPTRQMQNKQIILVH
jgi:hypothetical protein